MKSRLHFFIPIITYLIIGGSFVPRLLGTSSREPWSADQLLSPEQLSKIIRDPGAKKPYLFCVGPGAVIRGSIDTGPSGDSTNLNKLRLALGSLPKDAAIVIYCGCCPFEHCPNIRPAFSLLNDLQFTHQKLLNLEHNIRKDWIDQGYPVQP